ncbi:MAG: Bcr/CflA family multidrug efflux MFS transporter [Rhodospirillales bacterium]
MTPPTDIAATSDAALLTPSPQQVMRGSKVLLPLLATLMAFAPMSIDMYLPSFPSLMVSLHTDASHVQLTLSAFLFGFGIAPLFYGPIADRFGRRPTLIVSSVLYIAASAACALVSEVDHLIAARFLQALAAGGGPVVVRAIIRDLYERNDAARMMSVMMVVIGVVPMLAPLLGGYVLLGMGWRAIFWVLAGFGVVCLVLSVGVLRETLHKRHRRRLAVGSALSSYFTLLRNRRYMGYVLTASLLFAAMFAYLSGSPFVFIQVFHVPDQYYGLLFAINVLGMIGTAAINSHLVRAHGPHKLLRIGVFVIALSAAAQLFVGLTGWGGLPALIVALLPMFCALSLIAPNATACALQDFPHMAGTASALSGCLQFGVGAFSGALVGVLFNGTALPMILVIATCALCCVACWFFLVRRNLVA